jgi:Na+(H+)/acetate symporter ActP
MDQFGRDFYSVLQLLATVAGVAGLPLVVVELYRGYKKQPKRVSGLIASSVLIATLWATRSSVAPAVAFLFTFHGDIDDALFGGLYGLHALPGWLGVWIETSQSNESRRHSGFAPVQVGNAIVAAWFTYGIGGFVAFAPGLFRLPFVFNLLVAFIFGRVMVRAFQAQHALHPLPSDDGATG